MVMAFWLALVLFLAWLFQQQLERRHNPNRSLLLEASSGPVVLQRNAAGHYLAAGRVNGHPVTFLIDTGATDVVVPGRLARQLALKPGATIFSQTANGLSRGWRTRIDQLQLGSIVFGDIRASIMPGYQGRELLLGMSFLKRLKLVQQGDTLTLSPPD